MTIFIYILLQNSGGSQVIVGGLVAGLIIYFALKSLESIKKKQSKSKIDNAIHNAQNSLKINPNDDEAIALIGMDSYTKGDIIKAKNFLEKAMAVNSNNLGVKIYLTLVHHDLKEYQRTEEYGWSVVEYIEKSNNNPKLILKIHEMFGQAFPLCFYYLGHAHYIKGDKEGAANFKLAAIKLDKSLEKIGLY